LTVTLSVPPFDVPPKPRQLTAAPSAHLLAVLKVDPILLADESGDYIDPTDGDEPPMGKRQDWVTPTPSDYGSEKRDM
tara:strand:+ start:279 stop:512 length:234 start_codon:yes stop_codon:yes gene_type:complete